MPRRHPRCRSILHPRNDAGLGLAEMVVAIAVVMFVLVAAGAAFVRMGQAQRSAEGSDRGTMMIQDELETIRKLRYDQVGCYSNDPLCTPTVNGEDRVRLSPDPKEGVTARPITKVVPVGRNNFTVTTAITWRAETDPSVYRAKRVAVKVTWKVGSAERTVSREWLRSPSAEDETPPGASAIPMSTCSASPYPFCNVSVTEGLVLSSPGDSFDKPVEFTVQMSRPTSTATISVGYATNQPLVMLNNGDNKTFTYVLSPGAVPAGVRPGPDTVTIKAVTDTGSTETTTKVVKWRFDVGAGADYRLENLEGRVDRFRTDPDDLNTDPPQGIEPLRPYFCVDMDGKLLQYTAMIFDEVNVDEMDKHTPPTLYATGMDPTNLTAVVSQAPSRQRSGNPGYKAYGSRGYVGVRNYSQGQLNTLRWSYGFQPGTVFSTTESTVIVQGERPADGHAGSTTKEMPVVRVGSTAECSIHSIPVPRPPDPLKAPTAVDRGDGTIDVSWDFEAPVTYNVYRKLNGGTPTLLTSTSQTSINDKPGDYPAITNYTYLYKAVNGTVESVNFSPDSDSVTLSYPSLVRGHNPFLYYRLGEPAGPEPYRASVNADSPGGYWPLADSGSPAVNQGAGSDGTSTTAAFGQPGPFGPAGAAGSVYFNGTSSFITVPDHAALDIPNAITVEAWIKPADNGKYRVIAIKTPGNGSDKNAFELRLDDTDKLSFVQTVDPNVYYRATSLATVSNGVWHHVAATKTAAGVVTLYIDGEIAPVSWQWPDIWTNAVPTNDAAMMIGKRPDNKNYFPGYISDVAVYPAALPSGNIKGHYQAFPVAVDSALLSNDEETPGNFGSYTHPILGESGLINDAANSAMRIGPLNASKSAPIVSSALSPSLTATTHQKTTTVEVWANLPDRTANGQLLFHSNGGYTGYIYGNSIGFGTSNGDLWGVTRPTAGGRHHYVFVLVYGKITKNKLYIDGVLQTGFTARTTPSPYPNRGLGSPIAFGSGIWNGAPLLGGATIDEIAIYDYELSAERATIHWDAGK